MHESDDCGAPLARLDGVGVTRGGADLLRDIGFSLRAGERWALLGENGAGKTTFLRVLRGDLPPTHGTRTYDLPGAGGAQNSPLGLRQRLALVSGDMQDLYAVHDWAATGLEVVQSGFFDSALLYCAPTADQRDAALAVMERLELLELAGKRMSRLSSGQARAVLLARALACRPNVLLLDECLEGLDAPARAAFLAALDRAAAADPRLAMVFSSHRAAEADGLPACLRLALVLTGGRMADSGPLPEVLQRLGCQHQPARTNHMSQPVQWDRAASGCSANHAFAPEGNAPPFPALCPPPRAVSGPFLARINGADVVVDGRTLLSSIHWTIRPGEHWAVLGANGAGKSTLLALLAGDIWPSAVDGPPGQVAYGFGQPGENLDETRRRIGRVGAAIDRDYGWDLRVDEAVWSGAFGSIGLYAEAGPELQERSRALLEFFGLAALAARRIRTLSRGQLRRVMLARALAGNPSLLLLDEPMSGLDAPARRDVRELFSRLARAGVPLVMVTHHTRDLPDEVGKVLRLKGGRIVFSGDRREYETTRTVRQG
ncbi:molybdate transport system ATP-binding protein [Humidesulfovibrio mexicanus]|uniref:Molybdate transport system ATP-binding protein n=1 Tax=Humidesulfovibrio mexicanus TaxID=147047 RepID=A0A238Y4U7_9BACT|nr:ATP-binding cassette domain-containing protein [Humidesulfovibrio mexicanus]SNR66296.1 molybdate transport system ATP-binding protein [Humidesulfovibrio mexicanus]